MATRNGDPMPYARRSRDAYMNYFETARDALTTEDKGGPVLRYDYTDERYVPLNPGQND